MDTDRRQNRMKLLGPTTSACQLRLLGSLRLLAIWLLFIACLIFPLAHADTISIDRAASWPLDIATQTKVFKDDTGELTLRQVQDAFQTDTSQLKPLTDTQVRADPTSAWWFNWSITNFDDHPVTLRLVLGPFNVRELDFYVAKGRDSTHVRGGWALPASQHDFSSRLPSLPLVLDAGQTVVVWARSAADRTRVVRPHLYTEAGFQAYELRMALWDAILFGGLLALGWTSLMIALMAKNRAFLMLALLTLSISVFEAAVRGYLQIYFWPESPFLRYRIVPVLGHLSIGLFSFFILELSRQEKFRIPLSRGFVVMGVLHCMLAGIAAAGHIHFAESIASYSRLLFAVLMLACAVILIRQGAPSRRLMLMVGLFIAARALVKFLEQWGWLPDFISPPGLDSVGINPVVALLGFYINLTLLSGWITLVGKQRTEAHQALASWQEQENLRLSAEVEKQTQALSEALKYAHEKNRQKTEILGYVGHDLRAPLATIVGYSRLIETADEKAKAEYLQAIQRNARYQMDLIDELLDYAKSELKPLELRPLPTPIATVLDDVAQQAGFLSQQQGNQFVCISDGELPAIVHVDERRLKQALLNLIANAAKFTRRGTISLTVAAHPASEASQWLLQFSVADTGAGIELDQQRHILEGMARAPVANGKMGLGLHIVQNIVRRMDGELYLHSVPSQGSCFAFQVGVKAEGSDTIVWQPPMLPSSQSSARANKPVATPASEAIPAEDRMELAILARDGHLTDIELWLQRIANTRPDCQDFINEIYRALHALDLPRIEALALAQR